jgi:hypothetical protein
MPPNKLIFTIISAIYLTGWIYAGDGSGTAEGKFPRGTLIDTVACLDNPEQTYSLYLPESSEADPPILVFLEPGARGKLPVGKYMGLAERYGFILACSNNGRNGPAELYRDALDAMIPDLVNRFNPDTTRLVLSGFSGGARYASIYSSIRMKAGVIVCGAGISPHGGAEQLKLPFYTGIVGRMDMNFIDVISSVQKAQLEGTPAWMIVWGGGHFWPDSLSFARALDQVLIYWHTRGLVSMPNPEIARISHDMSVQFDSLLTENRYYEAKMMEANLKIHPLFDPGSARWQEIISRIPSGEMQKKSDREWQKIQQREMAYIDTILSALDGINMAIYNQPDKLRPDSWWKMRGKQVNRIVDSDDAILSESGYRMYDYTWRSCWSWGVSHLENPAEAEQAARYFRAWCSFEPTSPQAFYLLSASYAIVGQKQKAIKALATAVENGFSRPDLVERSEAFDSLRSEKKFMDQVEKMKD